MTKKKEKKKTDPHKESRAKKKNKVRTMKICKTCAGFFPGGGHPAKILPIPPSDTCARFWTKACPPQPRFVPKNLKNLNTFLCQS